MAVTLSFDRGTLLISGRVSIPYGKWDSRVGAYRTEGYRYRDIVEYLERSRIPFEDKVQNPPPFPLIKDLSPDLRNYQEAALDAWTGAEKRGIVVLPTGAGKTLLALKLISRLQEPVLILAITIELLEQWRQSVKEALGVEPSLYGGDCDAPWEP